MTCRGCEQPMAASTDTTASWRSRHVARGLCRGCYDLDLAPEDRASFERLTRSADDLLEDWQVLRGEGFTTTQAAERLGMQPASFKRALRRARNRGDERAAA